MQPIKATKALADFASGLNPSNLTPSLQTQLTIYLLDYLRVANIGERMTWSTQARQFTLECANLQPQAHVAACALFSNQTMDVLSATFLNTIYSGSVDADDVHVGAMLHPGCVVISAALACSQATQASPEQTLLAILAGYECMIRIGLAVQPGHFKRGFQATATCGVFGAGVAAAKLLFQGKDQALKINQTLGLCSSLSAGITQFFHSGSTVKRMHAAQAASSGVKAALLVKAGFDGPLDGLEGVDGFMRAYSDTSNLSALLDDLGHGYETLGVSIKPHASSARVLSAIEAASTLAAQEDFDLEQIDRIVLGIPKVIEGRLTSTHVHDLQAAQMSAPFCLSMALAMKLKDHQALSIDDFQTHLNSKLTQSLCAKVQIQLDPEVEQTSSKESVSAKLTLTMKNAQVRKSFIAAPLGSASRPYSFAQIQAQTRSELSKRYDPKRVENIMDHVLHFAPRGSAQVLMQLLEQQGH